MQPSTWNDERITAYVLGELSASEAAQIEADMRVNSELAIAVNEARAVTHQLIAMYSAESPMSLDAVKRKEILEAPVSLPMPAMVLPETAVRGAARRYFALAACILLLGSVATVFYRMDTANRDLSPQVALSTKSMVEIESVDKSVTDEALARGVVAKESLQRDEFKSDDPLLAVEEASPQLGRPSLELAMQPASTVDGPAMAGRVSGQAAIASEIPLQANLGDSSLQPEVDMPRDERQAAGDEFRSLKRKEAAPGEIAALSSEPKTDRSTPLAAAFSIPPPSPAAMPAAAESMESDFRSLSDPGAKLSVSDQRFRQSGQGLDKYVMDSERSLSTLADSPIEMARAKSSAPSAPMVAKPLTFEFQGQGAGLGGDRFDPIDENGFKRVNEAPLSTFSIDVDTASYSKVRQFVLRSGALPPPGAVRIEELVNYFDYGYEPPAASDEHPFASRVEVAACPWKPEHRLARIAIKGKVMENASRPTSNLVFLVDTSGSMNEPNKLPLVKQGLQKLVGQLGERDRVAVVVYAGSAGLVLDSTPASDQSTILRKINQMQSGGSTNGSQGIRLAYQVARDHFIKGGVNRVILCSDGDFNVGVTSDDELVGLVETESKGGIDITVLGFGMGNHNDSMMEKISGRGNGNYAFIDSEAEAQRVLVEQTSGTLVTIARDVKIQIEFNPAEVAAYRLIGYENRKLADEDFKDDTKDAGEIGAGHSVTALYELIPAGGDVVTLAPTVDELRYQKEVTLAEASKSGELMTVKLRYKKPDSDKSIPVSFPATDGKRSFAEATEDFRFASAVAGFGMLLRSSEHIGNWTLSDVQQVAEGSKGQDTHGLRTEFVEIVRRANQLKTSER